MLRGRRKLPVLAEISAPAPDRTRVFSLRRDDLAGLADLQEELNGRRVLLVTGEEGAARTVAVAVAGAVCAAGRRVALADFDLAAPRLAAELGLAEAPGVHEYLRWEATAPEILQALALAGPASAGAGAPLTFIAAGRQAPDPAVLLGLQSFRHMTEKLRHAYELVVLAGPALGASMGARGKPASETGGVPVRPESEVGGVLGRPAIETDGVPGSEAGSVLGTLAKEADGVLAGLTPEQASGRRARAAGAAFRPLPADTLGAIVVTDP